MPRGDAPAALPGVSTAAASLAGQPVGPVLRFAAVPSPRRRQLPARLVRTLERLDAEQLQIIEIMALAIARGAI